MPPGKAGVLNHLAHCNTTDMEEIKDFLNAVYYDNALWQFGLFFLILLLGLTLKRFLSRILNLLFYRLIRHKVRGVPLEQFHALLHKPVSLALMLVFFYIAFARLQFPEGWEMAPANEFGLNMFLYRAYYILLYSSIIWVALRLTDFLRLILQERMDATEDKFAAQFIPFFVDSIKLVVVIFGVLIMLGWVFGINVGTLVAGVGLGGLAVALAAKESLENLFGSLTIFLDKPFVVGDLVTVSGITGVVEKVGFRSTRMRTLDKSYVTLPNKKMIDSELDNLSLRTFRRANFVVGLTYSTRIEQMKAVVADIQTMIDNHPNTNQEGLVRFKEFGNSSLDIMVVYFVDTMDWATYLDVKQEINYGIMEIVKKHGADFAFPSRSIYFEKDVTP